MKKITYLALALLSLNAYSQEHFSGITTSKRVGILNGSMNPSEFANLSSKYEVEITSFSVNMSNNKVGFKDLMKGEDIEGLIFDGKENVNFDISTVINLPSFGMRYKKWGFGFAPKAYVKASIIDLDSDLGNALINNKLDSTIGTNILSTENQRVNATTYGEVGISVARSLYQTEKHQINAGITLKLLFPGSYANLGLNNFTGKVTNDPINGLSLTETETSLNIAYSGNFGSSFSETDDYIKSVFGGLNGFATDFGVDYQLLREDKSYKLKVGASIKNMGSMTFSGDDNVSENYALNIPVGQSLDLDVFDGVNGVQDIEAVLNQYPQYFTKSTPSDEFKVKLPTVFNLYADYNIVKRVSVTGFLQQKMGDQSGNDQLTSQNMFTITPRVTFGAFETFIPIGNSEISGGTVGLGFRIGGFFLGSNSALSALTSDTKQADVYFGFRFGFRKN